MTDKNSIIDAVEQRARELHADKGVFFAPNFLRQALAEVLAAAGPVGSIHRAHFTSVADGHWCKEVLLYSPGNPGDYAEQRVQLFTAPPADAPSLNWAPISTAPEHEAIIAYCRKNGIFVGLKKDVMIPSASGWVPTHWSKYPTSTEVDNPADERDARIAELEESAARWGKFAAECCRERDSLRTQLAAAQAAMQSALKWCPENGQAERILDAAIATDQSAAGSENANL